MCVKGKWNSLQAQIGLMYSSDYALSLGGKILELILSEIYEILKTGWRHISNNDIKELNQHEWTMSRYGYFSNDDSENA